MTYNDDELDARLDRIEETVARLEDLAAELVRLAEVWAEENRRRSA